MIRWVGALERLSDRARARVEYALVAAYGVFWFSTRADPKVLNPGYTAWMLNGDWAATYHGWLFHIGGPWTVPPGLTPQLLHPWGTSVFYTNSVYWLCLVGKVIAPLVDSEFQLYGLYLASSFVGLSVVSLWLFRRYQLDFVSRVVGAAVVVMNPVVMARFGHIALTAHWIVLLQVALALDTARNPEAGRRNARAALAAAVASVGLEGYLAAISIPLAAAGLVVAHLRGRLPWRELGAYAAVLVTGTAVMLWLVGAFTGGPVGRTAEGFGEFSADLTTLFNSIGLSRWIPGIPVMPRQGEGFGYLGVGVLVLLAIALIGAAVRWRQTGRSVLAVWPLGAVCLAEALYALSARISFAGRPIVELWGAFELLGPLPSMFRTSGRFIWPLHWLLVVTAIIAASRVLGRRTAIPVLLAAAVAQGLEIPPRPQVFAPRHVGRMSAVWDGIGREYRHLELVPIQIQWICPYNEELVARLSQLAFREGLSFNSGLVGRAPEGIGQRCHARHAGPIDEQTVYVVNPAYLPDFAGGRCGVLDDVWVCVSVARDTALSRRLATRPP